MISALFRSNHLWRAYGVGLLVVGLLLLALSANEQLALYPGGGQPLYLWMQQLPTPLLLTFNILLLLGGAVLFNELLVHEKISKGYNSLFFLAYLMAGLAYLPWLGLQPAIYPSFLLMFILRNMMIAGNSRRQLSLVFDAGLLGGIAFLIYQPAWVLFPISFLSIILGGMLRWRGLLLWLLGYGTPFYLLAAIAYLMNNQGLFWSVFDFADFDFVQLHLPNEAQKLLLALILSFFIVGVAISFVGGNLKTNALRNAQRIFFILLICSVVAILFLPGDGWMNAAMFYPVGAFYLGRMLESIPKKSWFNLLMLLWLGLLLVNSGIF
jgi:hypothetical protein